ncbi:MAG TPA: PspC domain-containing protein, partial [Intrasporangium sp.]|nr:PspC domain-containing protein [Intrasporangium sp.]
MDTAQHPSGAATPPAPRGTPRPPLVRPRSGRVIGGVAIGLANHLGVPVKVVRIIFVLTSVPFAAGLTVYVFLWATMRNATAGDPELSPAVARAGSGQPLSASAIRTWIRSGNQAVVLTVLGIAVLVAAGAMWLGSAGINVHPEVVLPVVAIGIGAVFFWSQLDDAGPSGSRRPVRWIWLVVGLGLVTLGLVGLLARGTNLGDLWQVAGAVLAALVGLAVLSAPWILRLWSNLR